jgi:hypothetical protein
MASMPAARRGGRLEKRCDHHAPRNFVALAGEDRLVPARELCLASAEKVSIPVLCWPRRSLLVACGGVRTRSCGSGNVCCAGLAKVMRDYGKDAGNGCRTGNGGRLRGARRVARVWAPVHAPSASGWGPKTWGRGGFGGGANVQGPNAPSLMGLRWRTDQGGSCVPRGRRQVKPERYAPARR